MIRAIMFDLDGTLLNTLTDLANSCNYALKSLDFPTHPEESYKYFVGSGKDMLIQRALGDNATPNAFLRAEALFSQHYAIHGEDCTVPYDGVIPMLERLNQKGIICAVISNKPDQFCQILVPKYFGDLLSPVMGHLPNTPPKPDPHRVFQAMEQLGISPAETLYVGDTGVDMQTAKNSGLVAAGVLWGFRGLQELQENGADHICHSVEELESLIAQL